jgi:hypothetical protein
MNNQMTGDRRQMTDSCVPRSGTLYQGRSGEGRAGRLIQHKREVCEL